MSIEGSGAPGNGSGDSPPANGERRYTLPHWRVIVSKAGHFVLAIFLFILAIQLLKTGASALAPHLNVSSWNAISTLGLGALLAYLFLSGKPVAAFALTLFAAGGLTRLQAFTMLSGGRLGAAFIVLLIGFVYSVRGQQSEKQRSLGVGVLALVLTAVVYIPGIILGYGILKSGLLSGLDLTSAHVQSVIDLIWGPLVDLFSNHIPHVVLLPIGGAIMIVSIKLLDRVVPTNADRALHDARRARSTWVMFVMGFLVCLVTVSVSVALTILVPLVAKGFIKREEAVPYIMGANVATLADTALEAIIVGNATGVQIVLAEFLAVALITVICLLFFYRHISKMVLTLDDWVIGSTRRLWLFVGALFAVPLVLILVGVLMGPTTR